MTRGQENLDVSWDRNLLTVTLKHWKALFGRKIKLCVYKAGRQAVSVSLMTHTHELCVTNRSLKKLSALWSVLFADAYVAAHALIYLVKPCNHSTPRVLVSHHAMFCFHSRTGSGHHQTGSAAWDTLCSPTCWALCIQCTIHHTPYRLARHSFPLNPGVTEPVVTGQVYTVNACNSSPNTDITIMVLSM